MKSLALALALRLIEIDPGHFHAAQLHQTDLDGFSPEAHVYAPLGPDLAAHLNWIAGFNERANNPAHWSLRVFAGPDFLNQMRQEPAGNVVVLSGRNDRKIEYLTAAVAAGQHVLADKPWIISLPDLPKLEAVLDEADRKRLVAYDWMTLRFEPAFALQRALVGDPEIFGQPATGTSEHPAVYLENLHAILKRSGGVILRRPGWFFDVRQQGEPMADVGTHLVDIAEWTLFANQPVERKDAEVIRASHAPLRIGAEEFERISGEHAWPPYLRDQVKDGALDYFGINEAVFRLRGVYVRAKSSWEHEAAPGAKDSYFAFYEGSKARIELRQGPEQHFEAEVTVIPVRAAERAGLKALLEKKGFAVEEVAGRLRVRPPQVTGELTKTFLHFVKTPGSVPAWERTNMITKYFITTKAVAMARGDVR